MEPYVHNVKFYETDKMSITHHSNYIRWMEEARLDYLMRIGCDYRELEAMGIVSPVISVESKYVKTTTYGDDVFITVNIEKFNGLRLCVAYEMTCCGNLVCIARSEHCFLDEQGRIVYLKRKAPDYFKRLRGALGFSDKN